MLIEDLLSTTRTESTQGITKLRKKEEEESSLPLSWGGDSVSISAEARAKQQAAAASGEEDSSNEDAAKEASGKLSEIIQRATGGGSGGGDSSANIEALRKQLTQLQGKLAQVAGSSMPDEAKQGQIASINAQISQLISQIAEMESEAAKQG